jgi:hypothetical protein
MSEVAQWKPALPTGREGVLIEGFPPHLREAVLVWLAAVVANSQNFHSSSFFVRYQAVAMQDLGFLSGRQHWAFDTAPSLRQIDDMSFTNIVDFALWEMPQGASAAPLESILSNGSSKWRVIRAGAKLKLGLRVPLGVQSAVDEVLASQDAASMKLSEAWGDAFGVKPRASVAYYNAVVAVESAALKVIRTSVPEPTLANLFSILEAESPKWRLTFRDSEKAPGARALASMLRTLWRGHDSRHGAADYADCSIEEARAAVMLAATLVWWFGNGVVVPVA